MAGAGKPAGASLASGGAGQATEVLILMATHDGARFLAEQLDSIAAQDHGSWQLLVSDDASGDGTRDLVRAFAARQPEGRVRLLEGPGLGATENFRSLLRRADLAGRPVAFCDQDDVWEGDHLSRGLAALSALPGGPGGLGIYGSRMRVCDAGLAPLRLTPLPGRPLGFRNALVQNVISGNTMVLTPAAAALLQAAEREAGPFPLHDWWAYQLVTGAGGRAVLDAHPGVHYRQHGGNVVGANRGLRSLPGRIGRHLRGRHREWALQNSAALACSAGRLTAEHRAVLAAFAAALAAPRGRRVGAFRRAGTYHQGMQARLGFWVSVLLGRF